MLRGAPREHLPHPKARQKKRVFKLHWKPHAEETAFRSSGNCFQRHDATIKMALQLVAIPLGLYDGSILRRAPCEDCRGHAGIYKRGGLEVSWSDVFIYLKSKGIPL